MLVVFLWRAGGFSCSLKAIHKNLRKKSEICLKNVTFNFYFYFWSSKTSIWIRIRVLDPDTGVGFGIGLTEKPGSGSGSGFSISGAKTLVDRQTVAK
jgi:hypothetical protein